MVAQWQLPRDLEKLIELRITQMLTFVTFNFRKNLSFTSDMVREVIHTPLLRKFETITNEPNYTIGAEFWNILYKLYPE